MTDPRLIALSSNPGQVEPGPFSEHDLREQWNAQADEFNQWESLDSSEQLAWAQARAIAADRNGRPAAPPAPEVWDGPSLADVDELCAEFGFHYDDTQGESLEILHQMVAAAITRWRAPAAQPAAQPVDVANLMRLTEGVEPFAPGDPDVDHILRLAEIIRKVDGRHDLGAAALAEAILAHPGFSGCHDGPVATAVQGEASESELKAAEECKRLSSGKLVSERIDELLAEVEQRGLVPVMIIVGNRAKQLLHKEMCKAFLLMHKGKPLPGVQDLMYFHGLPATKSDSEAAEYVAIECG